MVLLDAYALIALTTGEPAGVEVKEILKRENCAVVTVNVAECIDVLERVYMVPRDRVSELIGSLLAEALRALPVSIEMAVAAGQIRSDSYQGKVAALSMADCLLLAAASEGYEVATADPAVADVARERGIGLQLLPDSSGKSP